MIRAQLRKLSNKVSSQAKKLVGEHKNVEKRAFIDAYYDKIQDSVPGVSREDVIIIVTGFIGELRLLDKDNRGRIIKG